MKPFSDLGGTPIVDPLSRAISDRMQQPHVRLMPISSRACELRASHEIAVAEKTAINQATQPASHLVRLAADTMSAHRFEEKASDQKIGAAESQSAENVAASASQAISCQAGVSNANLSLALAKTAAEHVEAATTQVDNVHAATVKLRNEVDRIRGELQVIAGRQA